MQDILVLGGGAVGSFLAARIQQTQGNVCLIARGDRLASIQREGLLLDESGLKTRLRVSAKPDCAGLGKARMVLLCCKAGDLPAALDQIAESVGPQSSLVTLQNGVEAPEIVADRFPGSAVIAARLHGFFELRANMVQHVGVKPSVIFGQTHGSGDSAVPALADLLGKTEIAGSESSDITADLWQKFVLASAFGGVGAATGLGAGAMQREADAWALLMAAIKEVCTLAEYKNVKLPLDCASCTLAFVASFPSDATSSLKRDLEAGRPSEYAFLTGAVVRMAKQFGLDVPAFKKIDAMIRARGLIA